MGPAATKPIFLEADEKFHAFQNDGPLWPSRGTDGVKGELDKLEDIEVSQ